MTVIKHLSGPLRGEEQSLSDDRERITFGRSNSCDVVFPPEETIVGRKHFALVRKPSGDWSIDLFGNHYVDVNGVEAQPGQPVPKDAKIRLGTEKGPSFQVVGDPMAAAMQTGAATSPQKEQVPLPVRLRRHAKAGIAAFLVLVAAGLGWAYYDHVQKTEAAAQLDALAKGQAKVEEEQKKLASEQISTEAQQRLLRGAFIVMIQDKNGNFSPAASAFPISSNLLATNAHVGDLRAEAIEAGGKLFVRAPGANGELFEVVEAKIHPGWTRFPKYVDEADVVIETAGTTIGQRLDLLPAYDVALLRIDGTIPEDAILEIAPIEELHKLKPGDSLATAGYPMEAIGGSLSQGKGATPQLGFGSIRALTDYFVLPTDNTAQRRLIHHSIPVTGGASGSAIIGPSGHVIGLVNAGSILPIFDKVRKEVGRIPNAALVNFGQRADLVTDLVEDDAEAALASDETYWDQQAALFKRGADTRIPIALGAIEPPEPGAKLEMIFEQEGVLDESSDIVKRGDETFRLKSYKVNLDGGTPVVFLAYPKTGGLWLFYQGEDLSVKGQNKDEVLCPTISYTADANESGYLVVQGDDADIPYTIRTYKWTKAGS
jgi:Trypsin-like peptidase domain/FHA domain